MYALYGCAPAIVLKKKKKTDSCSNVDFIPNVTITPVPTCWGEHNICPPTFSAGMRTLAEASVWKVQSGFEVSESPPPFFGFHLHHRLCDSDRVDPPTPTVAKCTEKARKNNNNKTDVYCIQRSQKEMIPYLQMRSLYRPSTISTSLSTAVLFPPAFLQSSPIACARVLNPSDSFPGSTSLLTASPNSTASISGATLLFPYMPMPRYSARTAMSYRSYHCARIICGTPALQKEKKKKKDVRNRRQRSLGSLSAFTHSAPS